MAKTDKRARMRRIQRIAAELTLARGFDHFTMDDLAAEVGVSRRTLFNYVGDKVSAVIGVEDPEEIDAMKTALRESDPRDPLLTRGVNVVSSFFSSASLTAEDFDVVRLVTQACSREPKLSHAIAARVQCAVDQLTEIAAELEGWDPQGRRSRVFGRSLVMIAEEAFRATAAAYAEGRTDYTIEAAFHDCEKALREL